MVKIQIKSQNKTQNKNNNNNKKQNRKKNADSSSESSFNSSDSDSDYVEEEEEVTSSSNDDFDEDEKVAGSSKYTKFLSKMFPSKYANKKAKDLKQKEHEEELNKMETLEQKRKTRASHVIKAKNNKSRHVEKVKDEDEEDSESEYETESEHSSQSEDKKSNKHKKTSNVNIFFTVDDGNDEDDWEDDEEWEDDEDEEESSEEDEDVSVSTDEDSSEEDEDDEEEEYKPKKGKSKGSKENVKLEVNEKPKFDDNSVNDELLKKLLEMQSTNKNNKMINECVEACKEKIAQLTKKQQKKENKQKEKNQRIFKKLMFNKRLTNETLFFKKMPVQEQKTMIKELREINKIISVEKPYRLSLLESKIPINYKSEAMKKINQLKSMDPYCSEYYKIKHWVDSFMRIPFGKYQTLDVSINDGVESSHLFMENAKNILDTAVYGLNDAKMQIMQMLGQFITNPQSMGTAIAIKGPMGTGKTTLVKEGISKILNRPFAFIALGGATDSSFLEGHSYTYEGSVWGKIVQILMDSKCMNPIIYFDELDKISDTPKGEEIVGILTHLTDTSQNTQFHDKYFSEIDFDISKCLFIFSYNDESRISPILRDRMYRIQTKGYDKKQKTIIANNHILPKIREQVKFNADDIIISDEVLHYIIENYCDKEDGVRNQKRCLEIIYTKLNLYRLMRPGTNLFEQDMSIQVTFPFQVTKQVVDKLIKTTKDDNMSARAMYI
jgi:ATP-dependent Lon protease